MGQRRVHGDPPFAMAIEISPVPYSAPAQAELADTGFGAVVSGVNPNDLSANEFAEIEQLLYKHGVLVFKDAHMTPEGQYKLTKMFDPPADSYGHGAYPTHPHLRILTRHSTVIPGQGLRRGSIELAFRAVWVCSGCCEGEA